MTLHEAIEKLLKQKGRSMTTSEIADELNRNKWYSKKDGSLITAYQIHGRTANYHQIFKRDGSMVALINQSFQKRETVITNVKPVAVAIPNIEITATEIELNLLDETTFRKAELIDAIVSVNPGLYFIRILNPDALPEVFSRELKQRKNNLIYIGKASQSLKKRLLHQELRARGHGTFFRSIGAVLGYKPPRGSLINKKNKVNFKFYPEDEKKIISWINENLLINWIEFDSDIPLLESALIKKYNPLLNQDGNPNALQELKDLRQECIKVANDSGNH